MRHEIATCLSICHQRAVHKRTTMLAHCNLKQNMWLSSKQYSFFSFYALPTGGKSKDPVIHYNLFMMKNLSEKWQYFQNCLAAFLTAQRHPKFCQIQSTPQKCQIVKNGQFRSHCSLARN